MRLRASTIAIAAIMIGLVTVVILSPARVPIPVTGGYLNLSDILIYFAGFSFGPWIGLVAGGIGAGLGDILAGYAVFAPITLVAHGLQGLLAGLLGHNRRLPGMIVAWVLGSLAMVAGYYLGETIFMQMGLLPSESEAAITLIKSPALAEVPLNLLQNVLGLVGIPLVYLVRKAYPPVTEMGKPQRWREE